MEFLKLRRQRRQKLVITEKGYTLSGDCMQADIPDQDAESSEVFDSDLQQE